MCRNHEHILFVVLSLCYSSSPASPSIILVATAATAAAATSTAAAAYNKFNCSIFFLLRA
jgi:hypothetical protein